MLLLSLSRTLERLVITKIEFTCTNGHQQYIEFKGLAREQAEFTAKLMDGSSAAYKFPPGPESSIGKCGICNAQLTSRVLDEPAGDSPVNPQQASPPSST